MTSNLSTDPWTQRSARFNTTRWTMMLNGQTEGTQREAAWDHLCRTYWYPVYAFIRRRGTRAEDASDLTQAFFARLIEQDWLAQVRRREARFSTLLITILKNFLIKQYHHDVAQKRGGGEHPVPLDLVQAEKWYGQEPAAEENVEGRFEKRWAQAVMDAALVRLKEECESTGKGRVFTVLSPYLSREAATGDYEAAGTRLGINARSVAVAVHRLRADYRTMVREEVAAGLPDDKALVEEEMRALAAALTS